MLEYLKIQLATKKIKKEGVLYFFFFLFIFFLVDNLNMKYPEMYETYGVFLVILNIILNIIMALSSAFLMMLSSVMVGIKGVETKGSNLNFISILFALLTYGCTPCVIALLANFGIAFSVVVLPFAGLPYKFITLGLIFIGILWSYKDIKKGSCEIRLN